jgi:EpsI family protein
MRWSRSHFWIALIIVTAAAPLPALVGRNTPIPLQRPLRQLSYEIDGWHGTDEPIDPRVLEKLGTSDVLLRRYINARGDAVGLYISYFERQRRSEISHSPKNCLPGAGWEPMEAARVPYPLANDGADTINEVVFDKAGRRQLVYYWFQERGRVVASEYLVKWYLMWDVMTRQRSDGALLRVSAAIGESPEGARDELKGFMQAALPLINQFLPH